MIFQYICIALSLVLTVCFIIYGFNQYYLLIKARQYREPVAKPLPADPPAVSVQLPIYNEKYVVRRLVNAVTDMAETYGKDKVNILVLDDSDDDTVAVVDSVIQEYQQKNFHIKVFRRGNREGFKAGVLQAALKETPEQFVAIFDADFIPPKDFLNRTIPFLLDDPHLGVVQSRWAHLNRDYNQLTKAIAIGIDMHFYIDQAARYEAHLFQNFNGSGGVLRKQAILDGGGWQADTLAEDLDLSYRLQLKGYHIMYLKDLASPGEIPPTVPSYKKQQGRWACGSLRTAKKILPKIWRQSSMTLRQRFQAFIHLTSYMVHPLMTFSFFLTCISTLFNWNRVLSFQIDFSSSINGMLSSSHAANATLVSSQILLWAMIALLIMLSSVAPWIASFSTLQLEHLSLGDNLFSVIFLSILGFGISPDNTFEAGKALLSNRVWEFKRTPKYANIQTKTGWRAKKYQIAIDPMVLVELAFALLGVITIGFAFKNANYFPLIFLLPFTIAYITIFVLTLAQSKH